MWRRKRETPGIVYRRSKWRSIIRVTNAALEEVEEKLFEELGNWISSSHTPCQGFPSAVAFYLSPLASFLWERDESNWSGKSRRKRKHLKPYEIASVCCLLSFRKRQKQSEFFRSNSHERERKVFNCLRQSKILQKNLASAAAAPFLLLFRPDTILGLVFRCTSRAWSSCRLWFPPFFALSSWKIAKSALKPCRKPRNCPFPLPFFLSFLLQVPLSLNSLLFSFNGWLSRIDSLSLVALSWEKGEKTQFLSSREKEKKKELATFFPPVYVPLFLARNAHNFKAWRRRTWFILRRFLPSLACRVGVLKSKHSFWSGNEGTKREAEKKKNPLLSLSAFSQCRKCRRGFGDAQKTEKFSSSSTIPSVPIIQKTDKGKSFLCKDPFDVIKLLISHDKKERKTGEEKKGLSSHGSWIKFPIVFFFFFPSSNSFKLGMCPKGRRRKKLSSAAWGHHSSRSKKKKRDSFLRWDDDDAAQMTSCREEVEKKLKLSLFCAVKKEPQGKRREGGRRRSFNVASWEPLQAALGWPRRLERNSNKGGKWGQKMLGESRKEKATPKHLINYNTFAMSPVSSICKKSLFFSFLFMNHSVFVAFLS